MQWEYLIITLRPELDDRQEFINQIGAEGWEHYAVSGAGGAPVAYFKRPKQSAAFVDIGEPT